MRKSRKKIIITLIIIFLVLVLVAIGLFLVDKEQEEIQRQEEEAIINAEENFKKLFLNLEYSENKNEAITLSYKMKKDEQGKYKVDVYVPLVNIETDAAKSINDEINNIFGKKLLEVVKESTVYTKYSVDYIAYTNNNIISLIIKATLKEGSKAQRIIVKTYNYDLQENKLLSIEEYIEANKLDKQKMQTQILNYIREKNSNMNNLANENYNVYVRDVRSEEYLIENIENYYIGLDGHLYIVFAYGNDNETETVDIVIVKNEKVRTNEADI